MDKNSARINALRHFERARRQARFEQIASWLTGQDSRPMPFDAIRSELRQLSPMYQGVQEVGIDLIVGSVGRYHDLTRKFLPLNDSMRERWINIESLALSHEGWPPIELYKVGDAYFVRDGNHRVSVARQIAMPAIEAHVWEFPEDVQVNPDDRLDDVLIRLGERNFMARTELDQRYPEHQIHFTSPGRYPELLAQIESLKKTLAIIDGEEMPYHEAVDAWYEIVYLPTVQIIRDSTLLDDFPGRTESDLFVWLSSHRDSLREKYGDYEDLAHLAQMLADEYREGAVSRVARQVRRLLGGDVLPPLAEANKDEEK